MTHNPTNLKNLKKLMAASEREPEETDVFNALRGVRFSGVVAILITECFHISEWRSTRS